MILSLLMWIHKITIKDEQALCIHMSNYIDGQQSVQFMKIVNIYSKTILMLHRSI